MIDPRPQHADTTSTTDLVSPETLAAPAESPDVSRESSDGSRTSRTVEYDPEGYVPRRDVYPALEQKDAQIAELIERNNVQHNRLNELMRAAELHAEQLNTQSRNHAEAMDALRGDFDERMADFRRQVSETATEYARRHGWCAVVDEALQELDLSRIVTTITGTVTVTYPFSGQIAARCVGDVNSDWLRSSLRETPTPEFDSDFDSYSFEVGEIQVNYDVIED